MGISLPDLRRAGVRLGCIFFCLYVGPVVAAVVASGQYRYGYWIVSAACVAAWVIGRCRRASSRPVWTIAIAAFTAAANLLLAVSLYLQGTGFNDAYFAHLDAGTLGWIGSVYVVEVVVAGVWLLFMAWVPMELAVRSRTSRAAPAPSSPLALAVTRRVGAAAGWLGVLTWGPGLSIIHYGFDLLSRAQTATLVVRPAPVAATGNANAPEGGHYGMPNLVLVLAESLEASYADPNVVGSDLTPALSRLERGAVRFTAMEQIPAAAWTMGGMVASQCALPLDVPAPWIAEMVRTGFDFNPMNRATAASGVLPPETPCLGDILQGLGYHTVFMKGASLRFAGVGAFLTSHGFDETLGAEDHAERFPNRERWGPWGLEDDALFAFAASKIDMLDRGAEPYAMVVHTLDTHDPSGRHFSRSCGPAPLRQPMHAAVRCADQLVAGFLEGLVEQRSDMVVALMSDHLAMRNRIFPDPPRRGDGRRLRFVIWSHGFEPREIDRPGTHFDIAPTLLDAMGFSDYARFHAGASLLRFDSVWLTHPNPESLSLEVPHALTNLCPASGSRVVFDPEGPVVEVDGRRLLATADGYGLGDGAFALRFGDDGCVEAVPDLVDASDFVERGQGSWVLGLSANPELNEQLGWSGVALVWFAGPFGTAAMRTGDLTGANPVGIPWSIAPSAVADTAGPEVSRVREVDAE